MENSLNNPIEYLKNPEAAERLINGLIDRQPVSMWKNDLWKIFEGYMADNQTSGASSRINDEFLTFRDLLNFFNELESLMAVKHPDYK
jgi:hypothetical protein